MTASSASAAATTSARATSVHGTGVTSWGGAAATVGACAISGGPFQGSPEVADGIGNLFPVDLWVAGCPPHPLTVLDGLLRLLGAIDSGGASERG